MSYFCAFHRLFSFFCVLLQKDNNHFMKVAIITSGILPVPAILGGAVENLIDIYLDYNERHHLHNITIYSVNHPHINEDKAIHSKVNHYVFIDTKSLWARLRARFYALFHKNECYSYKLEYFFEKVYKKIKRKEFDLIILENRPGFAIKLKQRLNTTIISHLHTNMICASDEKTKSIVRATDRFVVVSDYLRREIDMVGVRHKTVVVHNGICSELFSYNKSKVEAREILGFGKNEFIVIYTGRLVPDKGIKELLQAFVLLNDEPDIKLIVVGGENFADSKNVNPFIEELYELGQQSKGTVRFTGFVPYKDLPKYLAIADVAVVPSHINEALGMTCIEATAMGLPVIATNDGGIPETLVGQKHILIDKNKDLVQELTQAILEIKSNYQNYTGNHLNPEFTTEEYSKRFFDSIKL